MNAAILLLSAISIFRMGGDIDLADAPNGAVLRTMGGDIRVTRGAGRIVAKTMGGNIDIRQLQGSAEAKSMGGDVKVNVVASGAGHDLEVRSMGGEIEVTLPRDFGADFVVELEEGDNDEQEHRIVSDFPLQIRESSRWRFFGGRHKVFTATGRSGSAANRVVISTIGSNITIRRR
jgi:DUF4097 and DUF4098 domain-containing protein YvlB